MKVYKFGGASVKSSTAVENVVKIIKTESSPLIVVVSAMGKMTNALEKIHVLRFKKEDYADELKSFYAYHGSIFEDLFLKETSFSKVLEDLIQEFEYTLNEPLGLSYGEEYDKVICYGELFSTQIIHEYCLKKGLNSKWVDARKVIKTNDKFQDAKVNWEASAAAFQSLEINSLVITQGFIASSEFSRPTSLGREGSDFSAAIFAYLSDAESLTIWKDVPGMLNADPRHFENTIKLDQISYREAIELSYYGASVIHPKTVKPLQNKKIPLYIKSFENPTAEGTVIQESSAYDHLAASYIFKEEQTLVSISPKDFSFMEEIELEEVFGALSKSCIKMNLMQNSALNFSFVFDHDDQKLEQLLNLISYSYRIKFNLGLKLLNVRYYNTKIVEQLTENYDILISQKTRTNVRLVLQDLES